MSLRRNWTGYMSGSRAGSGIQSRGPASGIMCPGWWRPGGEKGWTLVERAGEASPDGVQPLPRRADWDICGVRDDARDYVVQHLDDREGC
jgi:hypothetical protein